MSAEPGACAGVKPSFRLPLCPVSHPLRTSEKLVKAPRDGCAAGPRCLLCMCLLDIDTAGSYGGGGALVCGIWGPAPRGPSAYSACR